MTRWVCLKIGYSNSWSLFLSDNPRWCYFEVVNWLVWIYEHFSWKPWSWQHETGSVVPCPVHVPLNDLSWFILKPIHRVFSTSTSSPLFFPRFAVLPCWGALYPCFFWRHALEWGSAPPDVPEVPKKTTMLRAGRLVFDRWTQCSFLKGFWEVKVW